MADVFDFYVKDNRTIQFNLTEPIMLEDSHVSDWVFHIPRVLNNIDVSGWAWWLVYINARGQKYSELLTLSEDPESPLEKCIATYTVDYSMSIRAGVVRFSLEAINADTQGTILNEWHTQTYQAKVQDTLQGNQVEYTETESDIISALIVEVQNKVRQLVGGATPEPKSLIADMTDTKKVYLYVGSETGESTNYWYYYNGSAWVAGGLYASGITVDSTPAQGSSNAVSSGGVYAELTGLKEDINALKDVTTISETETQTVTDVITPTWTSGYVFTDGTVYANDTYQYSTKIDVQPGDIIQLRRADSLPINTIRYVTAYNNDVVDATLGGASVSTPYTVPNGVDQIIITVTASYGNATVDRTRTATVEVLTPKLQPDVDTLFNITASAKPGCIEYSFSLSANESYTSLDNFEDMCGYRICFDAKISSFSGITKIGKGIGQTYGAGIGFDGTNLYEYFSTSANPARTQAHGLTLKDYVSIIIDVPYSKTITVYISTNGGQYKWTVPVWRSYYGALTVTTEAALTDCKLSYTCEGLTKDTWIYGDSYLSFQDTTRWAYYLVDTGHISYLLNGYPGRNSRQALASLKIDLTMNRIPRRILWLLGMNDKDADSSPNANWQSCVEEVMSICESNRIELILATIPNVPSTATKNVLKNAYVESSGYRFIDFASAISADASSTWYDNMLSSDNVHPATQGAIALYNCAVAEVPELLI